VQFYKYVVLQDLRPILPAGMPSDYQLLMQSCWPVFSIELQPWFLKTCCCISYLALSRAADNLCHDMVTAVLFCCCLQFYEYVVLQHLRPILPADN
jgi:hypothetical protein